MTEGWLSRVYDVKWCSRQESHHGDDLQVLQIRPLSGQNLFGNKVGLVGGIPLQDKPEGEGNHQLTIVPTNREGWEGHS